MKADIHPKYVDAKVRCTAATPSPPVPPSPDLGRALQRVPSLLHRQAEAGGHRRSHRPLRASLRHAARQVTTHFAPFPGRRAAVAAGAVRDGVAPADGRTMSLDPERRRSARRQARRTGARALADRCRRRAARRPVPRRRGAARRRPHLGAARRGGPSAASARRWRWPSAPALARSTCSPTTAVRPASGPPGGDLRIRADVIPPSVHLVDGRSIIAASADPCP